MSKRFGFKPVPPTSSPQSGIDAASVAARPLLDEAPVDLRVRNEPQFAEAGLEFSDADLTAVLVSATTAMKVAEAAATEAVIALRKGDRS